MHVSFVFCVAWKPNNQLIDVSCFTCSWQSWRCHFHMSQTNVKRPDVRNQTKRWDARDGNSCLWNSFETKRKTFFWKCSQWCHFSCHCACTPHTHKRNLIREAGLRYAGLGKGPWLSCCLDVFFGLSFGPVWPFSGFLSLTEWRALSFGRRSGL